MIVPVLSKILNSHNTFVERVLPVQGEILVDNETVVKPYDHLGICTFSQKTLKLSDRFKPRSFKKNGQFYYFNTMLGKQGKTKIDAPYNGNLYKMPKGTYEFKEEDKKYTLLAGVWGKVTKMVEKNSVLISTKMIDISLVAATKTNFAGELVVFPNPAHLLEKFYLESFVSGSADGKIVYVGNHITTQFLKDAVRYGLSGVVGGSADKNTFEYARSAQINFGLFSGFGNVPTPDDVYSVLNNVRNRYVFFQGERNLLRIPKPLEEDAIDTKVKSSAVFVQVQKADRVFVLQKPYFGTTATVDSVGESSIFVRFSENENPVEIYLPNFFVLNKA